MFRFLRILFSCLLIFQIGCVSLDDVYSKHNRNSKKIKNFCNKVHEDYGISKSKIAITDCIINASLVERSNRYELYYWIVTGVSLTANLFLIPAVVMMISNAVISNR